MEPCGSKWTEGICAFQLSGQDPEPNSMGLESSLLACPFWNPPIPNSRGLKGVWPRGHGAKQSGNGVGGKETQKAAGSGD